MTDDSIEAKALALFNEVRVERGWEPLPHLFRPHFEAEAICRAIERHEAFKQEVSDVMTYIRALYPSLPRNFDRFIIPKPKPDPLVAAVYEVDNGPVWGSPEDYCNKIRAALEARGLEIREKNDG